MPQPDARRIMTADEIRRAIVRISHEIVEKQAGTEGLVLVGIQRRGVPLARRLADAISDHEGIRLPVGALDITFYRDDLSLIAQQGEEFEVLGGVSEQAADLADELYAASDRDKLREWGNEIDAPDKAH